MEQTVTEASEDKITQGKGKSEERAPSSDRALRNSERKRNLQRRGRSAWWKNSQEYYVIGHPGGTVS